MTSSSNKVYARRSLRVVDAESHDGSSEYKRQVHKELSTTRLRTLSTQMSYRLDEGKGRCTYHIGVEDDGCHSLLDYPAVSESAWILESIARSLNAIVLERKMIQSEIVEVVAGNNGEDGNDEAVDGDREEELSLVQDRSRVVVVEEPPVLGSRNINQGYNQNIGEENKEDEKEEKDGGEIKGGKNGKTMKKLCMEEGSYTRCELTIQRVETHMLDPSPLSLSSLSRASSMGEGVDGAMAMTELSELAGSLQLNNIDINGNTKEEETKSFSPLEEGEEKVENINNIGTTTWNDTSGDDRPISVEETLSSRNVRVAVVGNVDAGKSTLIGTLTSSFLDDGRGSSRTSIMKHRHEIESGRTSTSSSHLLGFNQSGECIAGRDKIRSNKMKSEDEIARSSYRIVTLMDLAGHEKYLKTTIHGVSSGMADYGLILVNSRHPPTHMTEHHLNLCCSYGIPVVVVFTKIDGCPEHALATSKKELGKLLKSPEIGKRPFTVRTEADVATCMGKLHTLAPMIDVSCVTGEGLDLLRKMLFALPKRRQHEKKLNRPFEFLVEDVFSNVPGVGSVVSGFVNAGELTVGSTQVFIGPTDDGTFLKTVAKSAHIARINTTRVTAGQSATLAFSLNKEMRKKLRRGMVVMRDNPTSTKEFDAEICVLKGEGTTIRESYQAYVHILNVRQTAFARNIEIVNNNALGLPPSHGAKLDSEGIVLRPGSRAKVRFEFAQRPEYIRPGMRMLFRDGRVRGVGIVTGIPTVTAT
eukprot:CAMPEP_0172313254 /NCGR_PEP_ID=MMETSP1058-20130122/19833_1 /TAXON_ID=83371 /ORGANISM="Detonula confervacea, Strain CCMP 353" /LENGTH=754 /DNA_ID=CAMNT_0013026877 /DNA_START=288 /DNA_END=2552 /DNA_ORIENTATION=-